jgi:three-Cys-motif partner protein
LLLYHYNPSVSTIAENLHAEEDGLVTPEVGSWAEEKYRLIALYDELFSKGMKDKWDLRVYVDLYAGAGFGKVRGTEIRLKGSPLIALNVEYPFDKYIFCEQDPEKLDALRQRVARLAPKADVVFIKGSCDSGVDDILRAIPRGSTGRKVLSLCLVDPFDFGFKFDTLKRLSAAYMDFLVLLAAQMDANRNYDSYTASGNTKIAHALGNHDWRQRWESSNLQRSRFPAFLAEEFSKSMTAIGFLPRKVHDMKLVKTYDNNMALYYLALFSKHQRAYEFWKDVLKYGTDQRALWD